MSTAAIVSVRRRLSSAREGELRTAWIGAAILAALVVGVILPGRFWPFVITGISEGGIYALAALGLVLTYKTSGIFNLAIGAQAAASAYVFYSLRVSEHLPWPVAAILAWIAVGLLGSLVLERMAYLLADAPTVMKVVASTGLLVLLQALLSGAYGSATLAFNAFLPNAGITVGGIKVLGSQIIITLVAVASTVGLYLFLRRHRVGLAMQALVDDPNLLALDAISPVVIRRYAWAIGSTFVSISGMLVAPLLGIDVNEMLLLYIAAFGAAAIGYFSNLPLTFLAAMAIGITSNLISYGLSSQTNVVLADLYTQIPFIALILALLFIPRRLLVERAVRRVRRFKPIAPMSPASVAAGSIGAVTLIIVLPYLVGAADINQYTAGLGLAVVFGSLGLVLWTSGQISLCQLAFAAVGATTFAHAQHAGIPWLLALVLAGVVAMPIGALAAIPSFRLSGIYLAVATFGLGLVFQNLVYPTFLMFGGQELQSTSRPDLSWLSVSSDQGYYYVTAAVAGACALAILAVRRARLGRLLRALSDSPAALDAHGARTRLTRLFVFVLAAFFAGIGGALIVGVTQSASGSASGTFSYFDSLAIVAVLAFCGRRPILGPVIAAVLFQVLEIYAPFNSTFFVNYEGVFFGVLAIGVAIVPAIRLPARTTRRAAERGARSPVLARTRPAVNGGVLS